MLTLLRICCSLPVVAAGAGAELTGTYWLRDRQGILAVYRHEAELRGRVVWLADRDRRDTENPDAKLRERKILGLVVLEGLTPGDDGVLEGRFYAFPRGKTLPVRVWLEGGDLQVKPNVALSFLAPTISLPTVAAADLPRDVHRARP